MHYNSQHIEMTDNPQKQAQQGQVQGEPMMSYGLQIPTKQQLRQIKQKVEVMKQAIIKERADRQTVQQELKELQQQYTATQQALLKREEKNENLLHESRQLKDILIREKQEIKNMEAELEMLKDKKRKGVRSSRNGAPGTQGQPQGWKNYLTSFWK